MEKNLKNGSMMGIDAGVASVGLAVVDKNYNIIEKSDKHAALKSCLYDDVTNNNKEKQLHRSSRRNNNHEKERIEDMNSLFISYYPKMDNFINKLHESFFCADDKVTGKNVLFDDPNFNDKDYYKMYPTVYHLMKYLRETDEMPDIRLVYLGLSYLAKNRGHYNFKGNENVSADLKGYVNILKENGILEGIDVKIFEKLLKEAIKIAQKKISVRDKKVELETKALSLGVKKFSSKKAYKALIILFGSKVKGSSLLIGEYDMSIALSDLCDEEKIPMYQMIFNDEYKIIEKAYEIWSFINFSKLLGKSQYLSDAKVLTYDKYREDLKKLQFIIDTLWTDKKEAFWKEYYKDFYKKRNKEKLKEIESEKKSMKKEAEAKGKKITFPSLRKYLNDFLGNNKKEEDNLEYNKRIKKLNKAKLKIFNKIRNEIINDIESDCFLVRPKGSHNRDVPMQLTKKEAKAIMENLERLESIPFIKNEKEKLLLCITFKRPYYVGPLKGKRSWAVLKSNEKVHVWNFDEVIDKEATIKNWMQTLISNCTYINEEPVLPAKSLIYSSYCVLNEINNIRVNNEKITIEEKQGIYKDLFMVKNTITMAAIKKYLVKYHGRNKDDVVTGIKENCTSSLSSYISLKDFKLSYNEKENLIMDMTVYSQDPNLYIKIAKEKYNLNDIQVSINVSNGWGKLSRKFLTHKYIIDTETGEAKNIMEILWETNDNLMVILNKYNFTEEYKEDTAIKTGFYDIDSLPISKAEKTGLRRIKKEVKRLVHEVGFVPDNFYIETTRSVKDSDHTEPESRKKIIKKILDSKSYKKSFLANKDLEEEFENISLNELKSDRIFLYFLQLGRCMYTGKVLSLCTIKNDTKAYDKDHIEPYSLSGNNELDNIVLVDGDYNHTKQDVYPIDETIQNSMMTLWLELKKLGLLSNEKFGRLVRKTPFTKDELTSFHDNQLNATSVINRYTKDMLNFIYPESNVFFTRAVHSSEVRNILGLTKFRDLNDIHHAHDAYLVCVVGDVYRRSLNKNHSFSNMFSKNRNDKFWNEGVRDTITKSLQNNDVYVYRDTTISKNQKFFDATLHKKKANLYPLKTNDPRYLNTEKYGGYTKLSVSYIAKVEYCDVKNVVNTIYVGIPTLYYGKTMDYLNSEFCKNKYKSLSKAKNVKIVKDFIPFKSEAKLNNGYEFYPSGTTGKYFTGGKKEQLNMDFNLTKSLKWACYNAVHKNSMKIIGSEDYQLLYDWFEDLFCNPNSKQFNRPNNPYKVTEGIKSVYADDYKKLSDYEKSFVISQLLEIAHCKPGDLRLIGGRENSGACNFNWV